MVSSQIDTAATSPLFRGNISENDAENPTSPNFEEPQDKKEKPKKKKESRDKVKGDYFEHRVLVKDALAEFENQPIVCENEFEEQLLKEVK